MEKLRHPSQIAVAEAVEVGDARRPHGRNGRNGSGR